MNPDLEKAPKEVRDWLDKTEKATGLKKSILIIGILTNYALKSKEEEKSSPTKRLRSTPRNVLKGEIFSCFYVLKRYIWIC